MNTHIPGDLYLDPQVNLSLPRADRTKWFPLESTFTAKGGEQYLTLGYFFSTRADELKNEYIAAKVAANRRRYGGESRVSEDEKAWLYLPPDEQKAYLKKHKKELKKKKKEQRRKRVQQQG